MTHPLAGKKPTKEMLVNLTDLVDAYYTQTPDPKIFAQRVAFGTSGHRGCSLKTSFNENHILAITQAICFYRKEHHITGPLFLGRDTHQLSLPALKSALEVLAANEIVVKLSQNDEYTPTPAISHAILNYNKTKREKADGIVITPSHNPPDEGGFKYNPPNGGPAGTEVTQWIQEKANVLLEHQLTSVKRISYEKALQAPTTERYDYLNPYVNELDQVVDMELIAQSNIHIGVDPLGGGWGALLEGHCTKVWNQFNRYK